MRVKEIKIEGLFDMFDHTIPLNMEERLSIVYGINGIGKSMLFKILNSLFNLDSDNVFNFHRYPFTCFKITYESGDMLMIENLGEGYMKITFNQNGEIETLFDNKKELDDLKRDKSTNQNIKHIQELRDLMDSKNTPQGSKNQNLISSKLKNVLGQTKMFFIETQRLIIFKRQEKSTIANLLSKDSFDKYDSVELYSTEMSEIIQSKRKERDKLSNSLQQSLHKRILDNSVQTNYSFEELNAVSASIEKRIEELKEVGLLEGVQMDNFKVTEDVDALKRAILSVNIQDIQKTLSIFDDLYPKFQKFIEILNERRLSFKKISLSENGFTFTNDKGKILNANDLSSGEQHELVLLYLLLFKIPENSLILIDEPEISLHITWQKAFLDDMKDIIKLRNFDIIVATHSPAIINGNWDLTIKLDGHGENE